MAICAKLPEKFEYKFSISEYLEDTINAEFNNKCYETIYKYYQNHHIKFSSRERFDEMVVDLFNRAYQCAINVVKGHVVGHWGMAEERETSAGYRNMYIMPDGEDLEKYSLHPQVVMSILYHLLREYAADENIGNIRTRIETNFKRDGMVDILYAKLSGASFYDIIVYPQKDKLICRIKQLIDGQGGAMIGAVLRRCRDLGYISSNPGEAQFCSEFAYEGSWQSVNNYIIGQEDKHIEKAKNVVIFPDEDHIWGKSSMPTIQRFR